MAHPKPRGAIINGLRRSRSRERLVKFRQAREECRQSELNAIRQADEIGCEFYDWHEAAASWRRLGDMYSRFMDTEREIMQCIK